MNKGELVAAMAKDAGISKAEAQAAMDSFLDNIGASLKGGAKVTLVGFGTFSVSARAARTGRNPQSGKPIKIPAKRVPRFTPGKALKDSIN
jgi:nucleoid DNA-binding protein